MVDVTIYSAGSKGVLREIDRIPNIQTIHDAREILQTLFTCYLENPEWNIRHAEINKSLTEGHIFGYCKDEHYMFVLEDSGCLTMMEVWNERIGL